MGFRLIKSDFLFNGKVFDVKVDEIEYDSGNKGIREVAVHPGGAVVVAVKNDGKIIMVNQFRYPLQKKIFELPAGKLDNNENPYNCAVRELEEETGYKAKKVEKLGQIYTTPGFCTEILHIYLAKELIHGDHNREEGEQGMEVFEFSKKEIEEKILHGEITDSKTICGIYLAQKYL
ncbi:MAG: NUDIX hydrolase [Ignavibacteriaceae bacterium]